MTTAFRCNKCGKIVSVISWNSRMGYPKEEEFCKCSDKLRKGNEK